MKKTYIQPLTTKVRMMAESQVLRASWGVDGDHKPTIEGNPGSIDAKENGFWDSEDTGWED